MNKKNDVDVVKDLLGIPLIVNLGEGKILRYKKISAGEYELVEENLKPSPNDIMSELIFTKWDESVQNLMGKPTRKKVSVHLQWKEVELKPKIVKASSFSQVIEAFNHLKLEAMDTDDAYIAFGDP
jgi:hypothetical protein